MVIEKINAAQMQQRINQVAQQKDDQSVSFVDSLNQALETIDLSSGQANAAARSLLTGDSAQLHDVVLAAEKAEIALRLTVHIRNKALEAYQEIMRMQV